MSAAKRLLPLHAVGRRFNPRDIRSVAEAAADILDGMNFMDEHDAAHARAVLKALRAHLGPKAGGR